MNTTTDHRLSDNDLTVLVERGAQGSWDSQLGPAAGTMWEEVPPATKNSYREQVLPVIFHGTKALHELGYRKPTVITSEDELERELIVKSASYLDAFYLPSPGAPFRNVVTGAWVTLTELNMRGDFFPVTVLWDPEAAA